jgi:hypothetical protein
VPDADPHADARTHRDVGVTARELLAKSSAAGATITVMYRSNPLYGPESAPRRREPAGPSGGLMAVAQLMRQEFDAKPYIGASYGELLPNAPAAPPLQGAERPQIPPWPEEERRAAMAAGNADNQPQALAVEQMMANAEKLGELEHPPLGPPDRSWTPVQRPVIEPCDWREEERQRAQRQAAQERLVAAVTVTCYGVAVSGDGIAWQRDTGDAWSTPVTELRTAQAPTIAIDYAHDHQPVGLRLSGARRRPVPLRGRRFGQRPIPRRAYAGRAHRRLPSEIRPATTTATRIAAAPAACPVELGRVARRAGRTRTSVSA